jgi:hypothetical protein
LQDEEPTTSLKVPGAHFEQVDDVEEENVPTGQFEQVEAPDDENVPAAHGEQSEVEPVCNEKYPGEQEMHFDNESAPEILENVPAGQFKQVEIPFAPFVSE